MQTEYKVRGIQYRRPQGLTIEDVGQIKRRLNLGTEKKSAIAKSFGVTVATIYAIANHRSWKEVDAAEDVE